MCRANSVWSCLLPASSICNTARRLPAVTPHSAVTHSLMSIRCKVKGGEERLVYLNNLSPGYFETMGARLIAGRDFNARDNTTAPRVIILGESTARAFWGAENPLGRIVRTEMPDGVKEPRREPYQVIGVVKDMKYESLSEATLKTGFFAFAQDRNDRQNTAYELRLKSLRTLGQVLPLVRAAMLETNKNLSLQFQTLDGQVSNSLIQPPLIVAVSAFFGVVALILAATGLYGVISYSTSRRKAEIGLRIA